MIFDSIISIVLLFLRNQVNQEIMMRKVTLIKIHMSIMHVVPHIPNTSGKNESDNLWMHFVHEDELIS